MIEIATAPPAPNEAGVLAGKLAESFGQMVQAYEQHFSLSREEALQRATAPPLDGGQRTLDGPPDQVSFFDLHQIARTDPDRAAARWEEVKKAALDELRTGHRAAEAVETFNAGAWQRARFLALREELSAEWQPRNGIERQLLDTMAQAQAGYLVWLHRLTTYTSLESCTNDRRIKDEGRWQPPRQSDADATEQAAAMMDRFNKMFLRTLRALCDMRRHSKPVIVQNGGQMNVAQQQVNLNTVPTEG
ncbi:hypothetical protein [Frigoriglobus tundricola]|uniref:Uncharacterized protein n=1 Tax=Frigoriglobus tundricola TaxID=2774151 RepID=A0A6M5YZ54_9BACT|nr:hypothetical protein [Frigoriglobus tundricola]QJW98521.1 hypothetical protein FTUN_6111 [Frigoriglobus tundricola]